MNLLHSLLRQRSVNGRNDVGTHTDEPQSIAAEVSMTPLRVVDLTVRCRRTDSSMNSGIEIPTVILSYKDRSEEHTSELQSHSDIVCRLLLEKKKKKRR